MKLIPQSEIDLVLANVNLDGHADEELLSDARFELAIKNFVVLHGYRELFPYTEADLFYNKYFWFKKFKELYLFFNDKKDYLNLSQQEIKLLEEAGSLSQIDWSLIEKIDKTSFDV